MAGCCCVVVLAATAVCWCEVEVVVAAVAVCLCTTIVLVTAGVVVGSLKKVVPIFSVFLNENESNTMRRFVRYN